MRVNAIGVQMIETTETDEPYNLWSADILECPGCKYTVAVVMPTQQPILSHYEEGFRTRAAGKVKFK